MLRGKNIVGQEKPPGIQHPGNIGHGERLLQTVVIDEHVGGDHEVEALSRRKVQRLGDDV